LIPIDGSRSFFWVLFQIGLLYSVIFTSMYAQSDTLKTLYTALIQSHLEYAVPVWDPHVCAKILTCWSQSRGSLATKICTKTWNALHYQDHLETLYLDTLHKRRAYLKQCHLYKLVHGLSVFPSSQITFSHPSHYHTHFNHSLSLHVPFSHSTTLIV